MIDVRIDTLEINNFRGIKHARFELNGKSTSILGLNGSGKSTIYAAFSWLLLGKTEDVKPLGNNGKVLSHTSVTSVYAELMVDKASACLKRELVEKFFTPRVGEKEPYVVNQSIYYIGGSEVLKSTYIKKIAWIFGCKPEYVKPLYYTLTSPEWFCKSCLGGNWMDRRKDLFRMHGGEIEDIDLIMSPFGERFAGLTDLIKKDNLKKSYRKLLKERETIRLQLEDVLLRIDEFAKESEDSKKLIDIDYGTASNEKKEYRIQREKLCDELYKMRRQVPAVNQELECVRNDLEALESQNRAHCIRHEMITDNKKNCDMREYAEERERLYKKWIELLPIYNAQQDRINSVIQDLLDKICLLDERIEHIHIVMLKCCRMKNAPRIKQKLEDTRKDLAARLDECNEKLSLFQEFVEYKVKCVENSINSRFLLVKWKMFNIDVFISDGQDDDNETEYECCIPTFRGIPYNNLSHGEHVLVGMDVIRAFSKCFDIKLPVFVDDADGVGDYTIDNEHGEQIIRLKHGGAVMGLTNFNED